LTEAHPFQPPAREPYPPQQIVVAPAGVNAPVAAAALGAQLPWAGVAFEVASTP
jgi:hypothetical protein